MARKRVAVDSIIERCALFAKTAWNNGFAEVGFTQLHGTNKSIRERIRAECPTTPGVYGMLSEEGHVVYVGMSKKLPSRLQSYFSSTSSRKKERRIRRRAVGVIWQPVAHELLARLRERQLIGRFRPSLNIQGQPVTMRTGYVIANVQEAPSLQLVPEIPREHAGVWGPVPHNSVSSSAVEELNLHFGLRDCPKQTFMAFQENSETLPPPPTCLRIDLKTCLRPCIGACSKTDYGKALDKAKRFLNGQTESLLSEMQGLMHAAASERHFEKAAKLRDRMKACEYLDHHLRRFHDWSRQASFVYRLNSGLDGTELWLLLVRGMLIDVLPKPKTNDEKESVASFIDRTEKQFNGSASQKNVSHPGEFETARAMFHWFQKYPAETKRQYSLKKARSLCTRKLKNAS